MARKLKTFVTSLGFFDQAVAAPSMKAALEAWGADSNLFHQGAARESDDPDVIAATMAKPGIVLKRPVGSDGTFGEHAALPTALGSGGKSPKLARKPKQKPKQKPGQTVDQAAGRKAALAYEREQKRRERVQAKEEAAARKASERRQAAVDRAQAALEEAEREHADRAAAIGSEWKALEKKELTEKSRWESERARLQQALKRARG